MKLTLLGTGAAAGWPQPFCTCAPCAAAAATGDVRAQTSVLLDDALLLDCGMDAARSAVRHGVDLRGVRAVLLTHDHHDHACGAALLWRRWSQVTTPLVVAGPKAALAVVREWLPPDDPGVEFRALAAGDRVDVAGYRVQALAAVHDSDDALLYDVTDAAGARVLYATDTAPGFAVPAGARYDVVLLEETWGDRPDVERAIHHDLPGFAGTVAALRGSGAIHAGTAVVAVHLGHRNPPPHELRARLAAFGAQLLPDGATLALGGPATVVPPRAQRTLVLGGARSGKSVTAERLLQAEPAVTYVATAVGDDADGEWAQRVALHRARRPAHWQTLETLDLVPLLRAATPSDPPLLVDCLTLWLSGVLDRCGAWTATAGAMQRAHDEVDALVAAWHDTAARVVAVSNEVGSGVVPEHASGRLFRDELGRLNARLAAASDRVIMVTAGIATTLRDIDPSSKETE